MAKTTNWSMNERQQRFVQILKENPDGISLHDIEYRYGEKFATGTINPLKAKGITETEEIFYECDVVRKDNGQVIGHTKKDATLFRLVQKD